MKIIKRRDWKVTVDCNCCKSTLQVEKNDIYFWEHTDYGNETTSGYHYKCPVCQQLNDIKSDLPQIVKDEVNRYRISRS